RLSYSMSTKVSAYHGIMYLVKQSGNSHQPSLRGPIDARTLNRPVATVTVMGGGLAGLAASLYLAKSGMQVTLIESKERLGGRASSVVAESGELVDYGLHVFCRHYLNLLAAMVEANNLDDDHISWFHETAYIDSSLALRKNALDRAPWPLHL